MLFPLPLPPSPAHLVLRFLNTLLAREAWARERLAKHAGKTARFVLARRDLSLTVLPDGQLALAAADAHADVVLTVKTESLTLATLARLRAGADDADALADMMHIAGDAAFAQVVAELARDLRPDWQDALAERIGDVAALRIAQGARVVRDGLRGGGERLAANVAEYLSEESDALLGRPAFETLREDFAALEARLDALAQRATLLESRLPC